MAQPNQSVQRWRRRYQRLLKLYPAAYRQDYAEPILQLFDDLVRDAPAEATHRIIRTAIADTSVSILREQAIALKRQLIPQEAPMTKRSFINRHRLALSLITVTVIIAALYVNEFVVPKLVEQTVAFRLQRLQLQQESVLGSAIGAIGVTGVPQVRAECGGSAQTHWHTSSDCRAFAFYPYHKAQPLPASLRDMYVTNAQALDVLLLKNGWVVDRPSDQITSIAGIIPTHPLADGEGEQMSYHKNIGHATCRLSVNYDGPTDGVSPGVVSVGEYSCSQQVSYWMPHIFTQARNPGYGG